MYPIVDCTGRAGRVPQSVYLQSLCWVRFALAEVAGQISNSMSAELHDGGLSPPRFYARIDLSHGHLTSWPLATDHDLIAEEKVGSLSETKDQRIMDPGRSLYHASGDVLMDCRFP